MKKRPYILLALSLTAGLLASCGGGTSSVSPTSSNNGTSVSSNGTTSVSSNGTTNSSDGTQGSQPGTSSSAEEITSFIISGDTSTSFVPPTTSGDPDVDISEFVTSDAEVDLAHGVVGPERHDDGVEAARGARRVVAVLGVKALQTGLEVFEQRLRAGGLDRVRRVGIGPVADQAQDHDDRYDGEDLDQSKKAHGFHYRKLLDKIVMLEYNICATIFQSVKRWIFRENTFW